MNQPKLQHRRSDIKIDQIIFLSNVPDNSGPTKYPEGNFSAVDVKLCMYSIGINSSFYMVTQL